MPYAGGMGQSSWKAPKRKPQPQGVIFNYPDTAPFEQACQPLHESMLQSNPDLQPVYEAIQKHNQQFSTVIKRKGEQYGSIRKVMNHILYVVAGGSFLVMWC